MARKIPLLPTWIILGAIFGAPFVRSALRGSGISESWAGPGTALIACSLIIVAGLVLYRMRALLPAPARKVRRTRFWSRRRDAAPEASEGQDDGPTA